MQQSAQEALLSTITLPITGGCFCGAIRFQVKAQPINQYYCHCSICRRYSGSPLTASATFPYSSFDLVSGEPHCFNTSPGYERMTCSVCGSLFGGRTNSEPKIAAIRMGSLDDHDAFTPKMHLYTSSQVSWLNIVDDLPRYSEGRT